MLRMSGENWKVGRQLNFDRRLRLILSVKVRETAEC